MKGGDNIAKKDIRVCRYKDCEHESTAIDIKVEPYVIIKHRFYHQDCAQKHEKNEEKRRKNEFAKKQLREEREKKRKESEQTKKDLFTIKDLWYRHLNPDVEFWQLTKILNYDIDILNYTSEYLLFVVRYVITHNMKLAYPKGLKYYLENTEIKSAYNKSQAKKKISKIPKFEFKDSDTAPNFTFKKEKNGFESIFGNK